MNKRSAVSLVLAAWVIGGAYLFEGCVGDTDTTSPDGATNDSTTNDVANDTQTPPDAGFTLSLTPGHVTEDPGDTFPVTINVNRAANFTDAVTFTLTTPPTLNATQPAPAGNSSLFYVTTPASTGLGDYQIVVTGTNGTLVETATLGVHVGSLLSIVDGGVAIPDFATSVEVKAWGAGGGAGPGGCSFQFDSGAAGGVGGYAYAIVPIAPGVYTVAVGTGGTYNASCEANGGGGGGYSGLLASDGGALLIAGGGGGGSSVWFFQSTYGLGQLGGNGGGLFGANGGYAAGGAPDGGGVGIGGGGSGTSLQGGSGGGGVNGTAGVPGGGNGGTHAGGGGGGYFGGAGGGDFPTQYGPDQSSAGGGGAGFAPYDGGVLITSDSGAPPNSADPDYASNAGAAGHNAAGVAGHVVIHLTKP